MPLEKPTATLGGNMWWTAIEHTEHFVLQAHRMPSVWPGNPFRILVEGNSFQIASARDKDTALADWRQVTALCQEEPLKVRIVVTRPAPPLPRPPYALIVTAYLSSAHSSLSRLVRAQLTISPGHPRALHDQGGDRQARIGAL